MNAMTGRGTGDMPPMATGLAANVIQTLQRQLEQAQSELAAAQARVKELEEVLQVVGMSAGFQYMSMETRDLINKTLAGVKP